MIDDLYTLENGEKVVVLVRYFFEDVIISAEELNEQFNGFTLYAIPVEDLIVNKMNSYMIPQASYSRLPVFSGIHGYKFKEELITHLNTHFSDFQDDELDCYELDVINTAGEHSKGIGSLLMKLAKEEILSMNAESEEPTTQTTHIIAEMVPDDESRREDLIHFYRKNGFVCKDAPFIYQLITP